MSSLTKRGVYLDLKESEYKSVLGNMTFVFSSLFHKYKFDTKYNEFLNERINALKKQYKFDVACQDLLLVYFYTKVENRGFLVYYKDKEISIDDVKFTSTID